VVELGLGVLIERGHTHIEGGALHRGSLRITHISELCRRTRKIYPLWTQISAPVETLSRWKPGAHLR
jgi:hypothetical protein